MPRSHSMGHAIEFNNGQWVYSDNGNPVESESRPCSRCGKLKTPEGYDPCLGYIPGATSACCGHGVAEPILKN